ncbi:histidinol dehydrogenase [Bacillus sp. RG28]|uniref:Histidinol dehydrogenase n=1 Tax=Gottfriedia endophytica TaxID=2820819 RepID=A0A940NHY8_9BACI|nr:histidinol dehydrogenase [Gottfriedia endophytica]MBP0725724.1 histidinol dehydrogenase [Gottfriedia endophytica]
MKIYQSTDQSNQLNKIISRSNLPTEQVEKVVKEIIQDVKENGDLAVSNYTKKFDGTELMNFEVSEEEFEQAFQETNQNVIDALLVAKENIERFHIKQKLTGYKIEETDQFIQQIVRPIQTVGLYIPGGKAAYPSTVLMNAIPAIIAGVKDVIMITPPNKEGKINNSLLVAAKISGVNRVFKVGGAQGVAALAYGTSQIPKVDKIVGPGNMYVATAKRLVSGIVGIDMIAGPTEVVIVADETANPRFIAADLMAQAEHDEMASSVVLTNSLSLAEQIQSEISMLIDEQPKKVIIEKAFDQYGAIILTDKMDDAIEIVNKMAPEHVEVMTENPIEMAEKITNAGAIFIGEYTPESVGDYYAGTNHTLPTSGTARFASSLSVLDFLKKTSVVYFSKQSLSKAKETIETLANEEGLYAHARSVSIRFEEGN